MKKPVTNLVASVRQRLLTLSRKEKRDFQEVLTRFALERLLYRLGQSEFRSQFVLKGALLFVLWSEEIHRFTQDMDLLGYGEPSLERLVAVFQAICLAEVEDDGLIFEAESVVGRSIREENVYGGVRITLRALLGQARIPMQIDIGFGDAVVPDPEEADFPALLDFPAARLRVYRRETSVRYRVSLPDGVPIGLTSAFAENSAKRIQWEAFVRQRVAVPNTTPALTEVVAKMRDFLLPPLQALQAEQSFTERWLPGGPWQAKSESS